MKLLLMIILAVSLINSQWSGDGSGGWNDDDEEGSGRDDDDDDDDDFSGDSYDHDDDDSDDNDEDLASVGLGKDVIELTDENFGRKVLKEKETGWMVDFYGTFCVNSKRFSKMCNSKRLVQPWAEAATRLKGRMNLGALDVDQHKSIAERFKIQDYLTILCGPVILYFDPGSSEPETYDEGHTADAIVRWAEEKLASLEELRPYEEDAYIDEEYQGILDNYSEEMYNDDDDTTADSLEVLKETVYETEEQPVYDYSDITDSEEEEKTVSEKNTREPHPTSHRMDVSIRKQFEEVDKIKQKLDADTNTIQKQFEDEIKGRKANSGQSPKVNCLLLILVLTVHWMFLNFSMSRRPRPRRLIQIRRRPAHLQ